MTLRPSGYAQRPNDLYETEPYGTNVLLRYLPVTGKLVWEPAAGNHKMADVLRESAARVVTSDIATHQREHDCRADFLYDGPPPPFAFDAIITNPPYGKRNALAVRFCELALERCSGDVAMLLPATFDFAKTRSHLFRDNPRFRMKIAFLDRLIWFENEARPSETGTGDHAWYVWGPAEGAPYQPTMLWEGREP